MALVSRWAIEVFGCPRPRVGLLLLGYRRAQPDIARGHLASAAARRSLSAGEFMR